MTLLSKTVYFTSKLLDSEHDNVVKIVATVYVPKLILKDTQVWRSHYLNLPTVSYAYLQFDGNVSQLENSTIRESCYGECLGVGICGNNEGATKSCIEKLVDGKWIILSGKHED